MYRSMRRATQHGVRVFWRVVQDSTDDFGVWSEIVQTTVGQRTLSNNGEVGSTCAELHWGMSRNHDTDTWYNSYIRRMTAMVSDWLIYWREQYP
jgi:hypothetical protein